MKARLILAGMLTALVMTWGGLAHAQGESVKTMLTGFEEVPAVSTHASGKFMAKVDHKAGIIEYRLFYSELEGEVLQAHIHLGQRGVNGFISVFLCTNLDNAPPGTDHPVPACPGPFSGMLEGMITAGDVIGPGAQGIAPGELDELIRAMDKGVTYVNVHSTMFPGGEIRGQLKDRFPRFDGLKDVLNLKQFDD